MVGGQCPAGFKNNLLSAWVAAFALHSGWGQSITFNRDIRPILSEYCIECHGPNKAKGGLRLDLAASATNVLKSGKCAIVPGKPEQSELLRRLNASDPDEKMPPLEKGKTAGKAQIQLLRDWIASGARWQNHWAFEPIRRPSVPTPSFPSSALNPIDAFIQEKLAGKALSPAPSADARTLARRLSFDLLGLPPAVAQIENFGGLSESYASMVDAALASPHFGERMAVWWLDLVRYADTEGYYLDAPRNIYPYRDYVIQAFNQNKRFDQFTIEQIAGDLLSAKDNAVTPLKHANMTRWEHLIASGYNRLLLTTRENGANASQYFAKYDADRVRNYSTVWLGLTIGCAECHDHKFDPISTRDFYSTAAFFADIKEVGVGAEPETFIPQSETDPTWLRFEEEGETRARLSAKQSAEMTNAKKWMTTRKEWIAAIQRTGKVPEPWVKDSAAILALARKSLRSPLSVPEQLRLNSFYLQPAEKRLRTFSFDESKFNGTMDRTLITESTIPRPIRVLPRGNWLDESQPLLAAAFPFFLTHPTAHDHPLTRLDLARWTVASRNPLPARVLANRLWLLFFGEGLVRTPENLGVQGDLPSHPELLDWLASELIESGWDIKHLIRLIVTSHTYQQSSARRFQNEDPENRLFSRQNQLPLPAEFIRDNALAISGLLSAGMGGKPVNLASFDGLSVKQEDLHLVSKPEEGERRYRRGVYLFWKRAGLNPSLAAFNAPAREECVITRNKSRGPQQALTLLNDPGYNDASNALGEKMLRSSSSNAGRIEAGMRYALARSVTDQESEILLGVFNEALQDFEAHPISAAQFLRTGRHQIPEDLDESRLAAWGSVARVILNLEETITRY